MARFDRIFEDAGVKKADPHPKRETKWLHYTKMVDNPAQYCNEKDISEIEALADLIEADNGVLQNLLVRKTDTDEYEIIAGHKRRRACKMLVELRGRKQYEFLPCTVQNLTDVQARFQVFSSNAHHVMSDYERMHELKEMKNILETYPEEFPQLQTGRMVERLARQLHMKKTTVGEYLTISNNPGDKGMEEFRKGNLKKSAAVELAGLPEREQEKLLGQGVILHKDIVAYKEKKMKKEKKEEKGVSANGSLETGIREKYQDGQPPLPQMKNNDQRKEWLRNYKDWGVWYRDGHIGAVYYKYDFMDGTRLIAETYETDDTSCYMHLVGGPQKREQTSYGIPKYPYHASYSRHPDSETELTEFLKAIQKQME